MCEKKNAYSSESKERDHFHPILEMKELRNKKVMLLAQGFMALRHNLTITIHSKKKTNTMMSMMHYKENMHNKISSNS